MKAVMIMLLTALWGSTSWAQTTVEISTSKTISLSFTAPVSYVDLGSPQIDARLVGPGSRVVLVKALESNFRETNMTVITAGDEVYTFHIRYSAEPLNDNIYVAPKATTATGYAASIIDNSRRATGMYSNKDGIYAQVRGIYVRDTLLFLHLKVSNATTLNYGIEAIRFLLVNKKSSRRMARQERSITPVAFKGNTTLVPQTGSTTLVAVLPKFTLSHNRRLVIELLERDGHRNLRLKVAPRKLAHAIALPAL